MIFMQINAEKLAISELCMRRTIWTARYRPFRVGLTAALYRALDAGLTSPAPERAAENEMLALAASPGLDVTGVSVYATAMHLAKLAAIISVALRSASEGPWIAWPESRLVLQGYPTLGWRSACYDAGDGLPRRIALVDRWSDDRREQELLGWRSLGEACALRKPVLLTAISIGPSHDKRRISPWTRAFLHPRNQAFFRFKRHNAAEDFGANWLPLWREDAEIPTADWLTQMRKDGCMGDLVHTATVPVPARRDDYAKEINRQQREIERWEERTGETPPMRLAGCFGFNPCPFLRVCHGSGPARPESYHFVPASSVLPADCAQRDGSPQNRTSS
jgi:hypothetical protein